MNILVLGGDGFIGSHFVDHAFSLGHTITVFDRFKYDHSNNLEHLRGKVGFLAGEFGNRENLKNALKNQDIVYHFISATTPASSWNDPYIEIDENLRYSVHLFELIAEQGIKKIAYCSSGGTVYGRKNGLIDEKSLPNPFSPYGISKLVTEYFLNYFQQRNKLAFDIYRVGNAYGPRQPMKTPQGVIAVWMGNILNDREIMVYGDHQTLRDYVYVKDVAYLMTHSLSDKSDSDIYNISSGKGVSILQLLDIFKSVIDRPFKYTLHPAREFDNTSVILDNSKISSYFPEFRYQELETGIADTWRFVKKTI